MFKSEIIEKFKRSENLTLFMTDYFTKINLDTSAKKYNN